MRALKDTATADECSWGFTGDEALMRKLTAMSGRMARGDEDMAGDLLQEALLHIAVRPHVQVNREYAASSAWGRMKDCLRADRKRTSNLESYEEWAQAQVEAEQ